MTAAPAETLSQSASVDSSASKFSIAPDVTPKAARSNVNMKQMARAPGHRLVEYFVVVSSLPRNASQSQPKEAAATSNLSNNVSYSSEFDEIPQNISIEDMEDMGEDGSLNFEPIITARYPQRDHPGNPLHQSVACFCYPGGVINLKSRPSMPKVRIELLRNILFTAGLQYRMSCIFNLYTCYICIWFANCSLLTFHLNINVYTYCTQLQN